jgi:hypothetical protein
MVAGAAVTPAAAQHPNWDWNNRNDDVRNPIAGYRQYYRSPGYGYGYGYGYTPDYGYAPSYGYGPSFYIGVGPGYGPRHYHW